MIFGNSLSGASSPVKSEQVWSIAKLAPHLQKSMPLLLLLFSILFCFYTKTGCIQRLEKNKLKKPSKPIQTYRLPLGHWYTVKTQIRHNRVRSLIMVSTDCLQIIKFDESYYL